MCLSILALGVYFYIDENTKCEGGAVPASDSLDLIMPLGQENCVEDGTFSQNTLDSLSWLPLTSLMIYVFAFSIGFGPIPWMMNGEFFSIEAKG